MLHSHTEPDVSGSEGRSGTYLLSARLMLYSCHTVSTTWLASLPGTFPPWGPPLLELKPSDAEVSFSHRWAGWQSAGQGGTRGHG